MRNMSREIKRMVLGEKSIAFAKGKPMGMQFNEPQASDVTLNSENEFVVKMYDGFEKESCREVVNKLSAFTDVVIEILDANDKLKKLGEAPIPVPTLRLVITSYGGGIYELLAVSNAVMQLKELGVVVITEVKGYAMSCGFFLYMLGDVRTVTSDFCTELLYHETQLHGVVMENSNVLMDEIIHYNDVILRKFKDIIVKETLITEEKLEEYRRKDWLMGLEEARELRVVNDVYLYEEAMKKLKEEDEKLSKENEEKNEIVSDENEEKNEISTDESAIEFDEEEDVQNLRDLLQKFLKDEEGEE